MVKDEESDGEGKQLRFSGEKCHTVVTQDPEVILDSNLNISLVKSKSLLVDEVVWKCENQIIMETNAGDTDVYEEVDVIDYGTSFFDETALTNIFGTSNMVRKVHKVYIDTNVENTFIVTNEKS